MWKVGIALLTHLFEVMFSIRAAAGRTRPARRTCRRRTARPTSCRRPSAPRRRQQTDRPPASSRLPHRDARAPPPRLDPQARNPQILRVKQNHSAYLILFVRPLICFSCGSEDKLIFCPGSAKVQPTASTPSAAELAKAASESRVSQGAAARLAGTSSRLEIHQFHCMNSSPASGDQSVVNPVRLFFTLLPCHVRPTAAGLCRMSCSARAATHVSSVTAYHCVGMSKASFAPPPVLPAGSPRRRSRAARRWTRRSAARRWRRRRSRRRRTRPGRRPPPSRPPPIRPRPRPRVVGLRGIPPPRSAHRRPPESRRPSPRPRLPPLRNWRRPPRSRASRRAPLQGALAGIFRHPIVERFMQAAQDINAGYRVDAALWFGRM